MKDADTMADVLFHAAMAIGSGRKNNFIGAVFDASRYLNDKVEWADRHAAINLYASLFGHKGEAWPLHFAMNGGRWLTPAHKNELLLTVLFAYEYVVQEMLGQRSPADPSALTVNIDESHLGLDYS